MAQYSSIGKMFYFKLSILVFNIMNKTPKIGLQGLLRPEDSIVVLIDHQPYQFTNLNRVIY